MKFATDKIGNGYLPTYLRLASKIGTSGSVCEVGIAGGDGLEMWQALFPDGVVVGVDKDPPGTYTDHGNVSIRWPEGTHEVVASQDDAALPAKLEALAPNGYDLIIDDASHDGVLTWRTWELLWPLVKPGSWYVIEDWFLGLDSWKGYNPERWDGSMQVTARKLLDLLGTPDSEVQSIRYQFGLVVLHKKGQ